MKLPEKAEEVYEATRKRYKQSVRLNFSNAEKARQKVGKCRNNPTSFSGLLLHLPKLFAGKDCAKSRCVPGLFESRPPFSTFSGSSARASRRDGKLLVMMRPTNKASDPHNRRFASRRHFLTERDAFVAVCRGREESGEGSLACPLFPSMAVLANKRLARRLNDRCPGTLIFPLVRMTSHVHPAEIQVQPSSYAPIVKNYLKSWYELLVFLEKGGRKFYDFPAFEGTERAPVKMAAGIAANRGFR